MIPVSEYENIEMIASNYDTINGKSQQSADQLFCVYQQHASNVQNSVIPGSEYENIEMVASNYEKINMADIDTSAKVYEKIKT